MGNDKREVNFDETLPPAEEAEEKEVEEGTDAQSDSSPDDNTTDESDSDEESEEQSEESEEPEEVETEPEPKIEPRPVEGETPVERARRLEIQRLKGLLRQERGKKLFGDEKIQQSEIPLSQEEQDFLGQYDQEQLQGLEKLVDVIGKKKGWAKKQELQTTTYQSQAQDILDDWMEAHLEYSPENDKDNVLWNQFQNILSTFYRKPDNPKIYKQIFDKVHADVFGIKTEAVNNKQINAQKEKIKVASHSGASAGTPKSHRKEASTVDPALANKLIGFSDEEKKEIL